ncbi:PAS domain S-box-containing protein [Cnuella takakiae]|uniref:histidine kinase n=1 Tax=Cnuella takakiae TaxID=1302690 RepID=A0A1M4Z743_9BACT|nr:PAS domain S-box protein [Cnuella takakiae]OLY94315.1 hypothetical protein BUE76_22315 [Cnuella takakiae]SHF13607.1 PAS domain S-box-containing protein [Cnuella takakiae]
MGKKNALSINPTAAIKSKLLDSINELVCAFDFEGRFVYVNEASYRILGYMPKELIGISCFDLVVEEDRNASRDAAMQGYQGADIPVYENRYIHKDGRIITIFWEGGWDFGDNILYSVGRDVTEQRRLELLQQQQHFALLNTQRELEQLLDRITDGFIGLDKDLRITFWNKAAEVISGLRADESIGRIFWEVLPEPSLETAQEHYNMVMNAGGPLQMEYFSKRINRWIEVNSYPSESGISVFFRDVTERKDFQEQLIQEKEKQQQRIAGAVIKATEKERAEIGKELHDNVNQVLTTVKLYTELCLADGGNRDELLHRSMGLLQSCINEIRGLSKRLSAPSLGKIRLCDSVAELLESIKVANRFNLVYEQYIAHLEVTNDVHIAVYRILQEHFTNIINHAKATEVAVTIFVEDNSLIVKVTDNGVGFDVRSVNPGIGIANMRNRAAELGGIVEIQSEINKGCKLNLVLPLS